MKYLNNSWNAYNILSTVSQVLLVLGLEHMSGLVPSCGVSPRRMRSIQGFAMRFWSLNTRMFSPDEVYRALVSPKTSTAFPAEWAWMWFATCCMLALRAWTSSVSELSKYISSLIEKRAMTCNIPRIGMKIVEIHVYAFVEPHSHHCKPLGSEAVCPGSL